ncbi:MAG: ATP-binding domain-containing protein [Pseudomonadota bacterium]|nr:ATP-binding domain-containing protein [Pseudomonadota bacterium]
MSDLPVLVAEESEVLARVVPALRALQSEDGERERALIERARELHRQWTDARGDPAQRIAFEEALDEAKRTLTSHRSARRSRDLPVGTPYFGRMVLQEGERRQEVLLGKVGVVERGLAICDWRDAPISQLYYTYEEGEEFEEEIGGRTREGVLAIRRRVDIREGVLVEVQGGATTLRMRPDGSYAAPGSSRAEKDDHRLPDIVSLITREQFQVIARPTAGVVLLRGRAGSGKTTVALHRIAYLHFQDAQRFRPERMLVVMFNKALQTYISRVLPELGVQGVMVETFHGWARRILRSGGIQLEMRGSTPAVARLKRHPAVGALLRAHVERLGEKSAAWVREQLGEAGAATWEATAGKGFARIAAFRKRHPGVWWNKLRGRLLDHCKDLWTLFDDDALCREVLPASLVSALPAARKHQAACAAEGVLDWEDAALLLRLGQLKHQADSELPCGWAGLYAHLVIDEAQDLSTVEIEALVDAADVGRSVTIAGDPAQKILADAQFEGFEELLRRLTGQVEVRLDALAVGHRSTRPIMALAIAALGQGPSADPAVVAARDGEPVEWIEGDDAALTTQVADAIARFRDIRPSALVAVLAKGKTTADQWARRLEGAGVVAVRRAARADFSFQPGVVVSNVHQVKGLEFDGVVLIEPAEFGEADKQLLHVAITRAADRLWVVAGRGRGRLAGQAPPVDTGEPRR